MSIKPCKTLLHVETTFIEGGRHVAVPLRLIAALAVVRNPWANYLTIQCAIPDAPASGEIVIALGASVGGRPHHRIGDRYQDLKDLGHDVSNPAAI